MRHIHILGICGTFMGGVARLARDLGFTVTGSDRNVYPPMSTQLEEAGIELMQGYEVEHLHKTKPDHVIIGNAMSRGNPVIEHILNTNIPHSSGPQWLYENLLRERWVLGIAGTHGKTTTSSMLAWILEAAGMKPGFLIGGVPGNFGVSAALGDSPFFVIEADEYDTAFFDKRSKFLHYRPRTLVLNNLEYDHADIFPDLDAIKRQFHHLLRTVPSAGLLVVNAEDANLAEVIKQGCWTPVQYYGLNADAEWKPQGAAKDGSSFEIHHANRKCGRVEWPLIGNHNIQNALAAIAAAQHAGVTPTVAIEALSQFKGVKRRLELRGVVRDIAVYDDFAHHPTAIETTLAGLRNRIGGARMIALLEPRSNTMRLGVHNDTLVHSLAAADAVWIYEPAGLNLQLDAKQNSSIRVCDSTDRMLFELTEYLQPDDHVVIMSNGDFNGLHSKLLARLQQG
ncbi:MAG TPA: UDP-N-acetylmuramate:L-alanyl-gamma-D-glutamyl-meso-diaminopimelate ligase [Gammaproteobacteria bacterium]